MYNLLPNLNTPDSATDGVDRFNMDHKMISDYFPKYHLSVGPCNEDGLSFL